MSYWEALGKSDDWYTPAYVFRALECSFDLDPANGAIGGAHVPCGVSYGSDGLEKDWFGFVWLNPPFGGRNGIKPWLDKFFRHGRGIALTPDRTSAPWWQEAARKSSAVLFVGRKIRFERPDGSEGKSPSTGTCLLAAGIEGQQALMRAARNGLGFVMVPDMRSVLSEAA